MLLLFFCVCLLGFLVILFALTLYSDTFLFAFLFAFTPFLLLLGIQLGSLSAAKVAYFISKAAFTNNCSIKNNFCLFDSGAISVM